MQIVTVIHCHFYHSRILTLFDRNFVSINNSWIT